MVEKEDGIMFRRVFIQRTFHMTFLMTMCVCAVVFAGTFQIAPVNPALQEGKAAMGENYGYIPEPVDWSHLEVQVGKADLPSRYDLRDSALVTPVKYQEDCGACWAFAACGVLESWSLIHGGETWDFSENHMKNTHGFSVGHCFGGNNSMATAYLARWNGPLSEADDPYNPDAVVPPLNDQPRKRLWAAPVYKATMADRSEIQSAIMQHGPVSSPMAYYDGYYSGSPAYTYHYAGTAATNHMITVVGWDDDIAVAGASGPGAWICKNSWSELWGDSGYFYISYYDSKAVKEATGFYDLTDPAVADRIYQYDDLGLTGMTGSPPSNVAYGANVFTAAANQTIIAVGTYAVANNMAYEIAVYDSGIAGDRFENPVTTVSGTCVNAGYYVIPLPVNVSVLNGQQFAVKVRYYTPGWAYPVPLEMPVPGYAAPTSVFGQSYLSEGGVSFEEISYSGEDYENTNVCIKAIAGIREITPPTPSVRIVGDPQAEIGTRVELKGAVENMTGTITYAWFKDEAPLSGQAGQQYIISSVEESHAGSYVLQVTDESKGIYTSPPFILEVLPAGTLPLSAVSILGALALVASGVGTLRRRAGKRE